MSVILWMVKSNKMAELPKHMIDIIQTKLGKCN